MPMRWMDIDELVLLPWGWTRKNLRGWGERGGISGIKVWSKTTTVNTFLFVLLLSNKRFCFVSFFKYEI